MSDQARGPLNYTSSTSLRQGKGESEREWEQKDSIVATLFAGASRGVEGHIDRDTAIEGDGGEVLIEEGLEHDHLVPLLEERGEDGVLAYGSSSVRYPEAE